MGQNAVRGVLRVPRSLLYAARPREHTATLSYRRQDADPKVDGTGMSVRVVVVGFESYWTLAVRRVPINRAV